jgi:hypothetical protein
MNTPESTPTSVIVTALILVMLVALRVLAFRWIAQARGYSFCASDSVRKFLLAFASFAIPGLGQAAQGRFETAAFHLLCSGITWLFIGWFAILLHILSALECARKCL